MIDVDKLEAGLEIDKLVAERVMGLELVRDEINRRGVAIFPGGPLGRDLPAYSTEIAAAWEVVPRLAEFCFRSIEYSNYGHATVKLWSPAREIYAHGATFELAICRAALKAVGA